MPSAVVSAILRSPMRQRPRTRARAGAIRRCLIRPHPHCRPRHIWLIPPLMDCRWASCHIRMAPCMAPR
jgi:hypothetical protein